MSIDWLKADFRWEEYHTERAKAIYHFLTNELDSKNIDDFIKLIKSNPEDDLYEYQFYRDLIERLANESLSALEANEISQYEEELKELLLDPDPSNIFLDECLEMIEVDMLVDDECTSSEVDNLSNEVMDDTIDIFKWWNWSKKDKRTKYLN